MKVPDAPAVLTVREPIGELTLELREATLTLLPSRSLRHIFAERMWRAEAANRQRRGALDGAVARVHGTGSGRPAEVWGEFPVSSCEVSLKDSRLHLKVNKFCMSFSSTSFVRSDADAFVRQFIGRRAEPTDECRPSAEWQREDTEA